MSAADRAPQVGDRVRIEQCVTGDERHRGKVGPVVVYTCTAASTRPHIHVLLDADSGFDCCASRVTVLPPAERVDAPCSYYIEIDGARMVCNAERAAPIHDKGHAYLPPAPAVEVVTDPAKIAEAFEREADAVYPTCVTLGPDCEKHPFQSSRKNPGRPGYAGPSTPPVCPPDCKLQHGKSKKAVQKAHLRAEIADTRARLKAMIDALVLIAGGYNSDAAARLSEAESEVASLRATKATLEKKIADITAGALELLSVEQTRRRKAEERVRELEAFVAKMFND